MACCSEHGDPLGALCELAVCRLFAGKVPSQHVTARIDALPPRLGLSLTRSPYAAVRACPISQELRLLSTLPAAVAQVGAERQLIPAVRSAFLRLCGLE